MRAVVKAEIVHTRETCLRLALVRDKCYGRPRLIVRAVLALIPIVIAGFVGFDTTGGILLVVLGVMFYYFTSGMYERDADRAFKATPEKFRQVTYTFEDAAFFVEAGGVRREMAYDKVLALVTDGFYHYLFLNPEQAYMMGLGDGARQREDDFEAFLAEKTGKTWHTVQVREPFFRHMRRQWTERNGKEK